jgi:hypothetical protein
MRDFVRASNLRWPELLARIREPSARGVQSVNLASRVPRDDLERIVVSECVLNKAVVVDIFLVYSFAIVFLRFLSL